MNILAPFRFPSAPDLPPPQPFHKYPDLALFKKIWSPAAFQDMSILTWSYRITFSAMSFMFIAFLVDAVAGNLYRYTLGNLKIYIDNEQYNKKHKIYVKKRNRVFANWGLATASAIGTVAAIYYLSPYLSGIQKTEKTQDHSTPPAPSISDTTKPSLFFWPESLSGRIILVAGGILSLLGGLNVFINPLTCFGGEVLEGKKTQKDIKAPYACTFISYHAVKAMLLGSLKIPSDIKPLLDEGKKHYDILYSKNEENMKKANAKTFPWPDVYAHYEKPLDDEGQPNKCNGGIILQSLSANSQRKFIPPGISYIQPYRPNEATPLQKYYQSMLDPFRGDYLDGKPQDTKIGAILTANKFTFSLVFTKNHDLTEKIEFFDSHGAVGRKAYKITFSGPDSYQKLIDFLNKLQPPAGEIEDFGLYPVCLR